MFVMVGSSSNLDHLEEGCFLVQVQVLLNLRTAGLVRRRCLLIRSSLVLFGKMLLFSLFTLFASQSFSANCFSSNGTLDEFILEAKRGCIPVHSQLGYHVSCSGIQVEAMIET